MRSYASSSHEVPDPPSQCLEYSYAELHFILETEVLNSLRLAQGLLLSGSQLRSVWEFSEFWRK